MKRINKIMSLEEYEAKVKEPLMNEITKGVKKSYKEVTDRIWVVTSWWYIIVSLLLIIGGIVVVIHGAASIGHSGNTLTSRIVLGVSTSLFGALLLFIRSYKLKKCNELYVKSMDKDKIYKIAINNLPDFELKEIVEDVIDESVEKYTYKIPNTAILDETSPLFKTMYKGKYEVTFQSARFHWIESSTGSDGGSSSHEVYGYSGFASISTNERDDDFLFCMKGGFLDSKIGAKKIKLENKEFVRRVKLKSNNPIKSRMVFTPLAMEEVLKYKNKIKNNFYVTKPDNHIYFGYETTRDQFVIDAVVTRKLDKIIAKYYADIISDFYSLYEKLGIIFIPPFL